MASDRDRTGQHPAAALLFLIPSCLGIGFFLLPIPAGDVITIPLAIAIDHLKELWAPALPAVAVALVVLSAVVTTLMQGLRRRPPSTDANRWIGLLQPGWIWTVVRMIGAGLAICAFLGIGPAILASPGVGGVLLNDLAPVLVVLFLLAGFLIPLLTDYGLMEFVGTIAAPVFRRVFRIPGRGAVDAVASWMGSSTVGTLITIEQYKAGRYTGREAATIACNFSLASVGFTYALVSTAKMAEHFPAVYGTIALSVLVCAVILCRIPPLSSIPHRLQDGRERLQNEALDASPRAAWNAALKRASNAPGPRQLFSNGLFSVASIYLGLLPSVFAIGGIGLLVAETTTLFSWIAQPYVPLLELLGLPDAALAAPSMVVGFADQFLTVIVGAQVPSEQMRFVIAVLAVAQILYFSELGALLLQSPIPIGFFSLLGVFILRTLITLPIAAGMSHLLF